MNIKSHFLSNTFLETLSPAYVDLTCIHLLSEMHFYISFLRSHELAIRICCNRKQNCDDDFKKLP